MATVSAVDLEPINRSVPVYRPMTTRDISLGPLFFALPDKRRNTPGSRNAARTEGVAANDVAISWA
jgi:hypothetical protein